MVSKFSTYLTNFFVLGQDKTEDQIEVIQYGIQAFICTSLGFLASALVGMSLDMLIETVLFTIVLVPLRVNFGGYHCKTCFRCILTYSCALYLILNILSFISTKTVFCIMLFFVSLVLIFATTRNKDVNLRKEFLLIYTILFFLFLVYYKTLSNCIIVVFLLEACLIKWKEVVC